MPSGRFARSLPRAKAIVRAPSSWPPKGVALQDAQAYNEPESWHRPVLGALLVETGRFAEAERVYRADLVRHPETGWALVGLRQSLEGQGRTAEAAAMGQRFDAAWAHADVTLTSSRIMSPDRR